MIKLIKANIYRMVKSRTLYIFIAVAVLISLICVYLLTNESGMFQTDFAGNIEELYKGINVTDSNYDYDIQGLGILVIECGVVLAVLSAFYISIFAGRSLDGGAVRNDLIMGHKKSSIYLSAFITDIISTAILSIAMFISISVYILAGGYHPIIWWPYLLLLIGLVYILALVISSFALMIVFFCRTYVAIIGTILITIALAVIPGVIVSSDGKLTQYIINDEIFNYYEPQELVTKEVIDWFDDANYRIVFIVDGERIPLKKTIKDLPQEQQIKVYIVKALPHALYVDYEIYLMNPYIIAGSGYATRCLAVSLVWIIVVNTAGVLIFRKKDIM